MKKGEGGGIHLLLEIDGNCLFEVSNFQGVIVFKIFQIYMKHVLEVAKGTYSF